MARTLADIQRSIAKLQKEAEGVKAKEVVGVIERIKAAIETYGLTSDDLFGTKVKKVRMPKVASAAKVKKTTKKTAAPMKFKDESTGKTWSGHGRRPDWYLKAIAGGKTPEDLAIKP
jgi:DNA-binding protein H-NS